MKFSIGDKVILKRTGEEGHVVAYINKQMVEVEVNGTHFPVYTDEVDHPYLKWFTEKKPQKPKSMPEQLPVEKEKARKSRLAKGVYLSFLPVFKANMMEDVVDLLKIHLINELPSVVKFSYDVRTVGGSEFKHTGKLHPFEHLYLHSIPFEDMNDQPRFHWELTAEENKKAEKKEGIVKIKPVKLFEHINSLLEKNEPMFSYLLIEDFIPKEKGEDAVFDAPSPIQKIDPKRTKPKTAWDDLPQYELDLHIEKLVTNIQGLSNIDMLQIQLGTLQRYLNLAIKHKQERMMIIHGLGKGKLRDEVHRILKETPQVDRFKNEWQGQYGFGATEVIFKY